MTRKIKAVIFDLDDTLMDTSGQLVKQGQTLATKAMIKTGLDLKEEEIEPLLEKVHEKYGLWSNSTTAILDELGVKGDEKERIAEIGYQAYHDVDVTGIVEFPGTSEMINELKKKGVIVVLMSHGTLVSREKKLAELGIKPLFDMIVIDDIAGTQDKTKYYNQIFEDLKKKGLSAEEILSVGDRIDSEIQVSKKLGMITARVSNEGKGRYFARKPTCDFETPDYTINYPADILNIEDLEFGS